MKTTVADSHYKIHCVRIVPVSGAIIYLTDYVHDLTMSSHVYLSDSGYQFTGLASESSFSPGTIDLSGIADIAGVGYNQIVSGVFDNARVYCFATTWLNPVEDEEPLGLAFMGKITLRDSRYTAELMMLIDALNQSTGRTYGTQCPKKFGGQEYAGCKLDLTTIDVTGTISNITDNSVFRDSSRTEVDDWFGEGTIQFTSGLNAGLKPMEIKTYLLNGTITTHEPFHYTVAIGDAYIMIPGCRKRQVDCRDKWANIVNFGGFSFIPTGSTYAS
jgi:uncharacterized phage protein (TIGR02218 family)